MKRCGIVHTRTTGRDVRSCFEQLTGGALNFLLRNAKGSEEELIALDSKSALVPGQDVGVEQPRSMKRTPSLNSSN